ncbi:hypothetical protein Hanom_Chr09g00762901 [Helianthus anomalus]
MHASKSRLGNDIAKSYLTRFAQEYSEMVYEKLMFYTGFPNKRIFRCTHEF